MPSEIASSKPSGFWRLVIALPEWLTAPEPPLFPWSPLPDPFERYGGHVAWAFWGGIALSHREWVAVRLGCPAGCDPPVQVPKADPMRRSAVWAAWRAFYHGCRTYRPINHSPETLASRGGWNALVCHDDTGPVPQVEAQVIQGQIY